MRYDCVLVIELLSLVKNDDKIEATITASICEVYNEQVYDLLSNKRVPRKLKQRGVRDCVAEGIVERKVSAACTNSVGNRRAVLVLPQHVSPVVLT